MDLKNVRKEVESSEAIILDVRELDEWNEGHLSCSQHLPISRLNEGFMPKDLPRDKKIYTHCRRGGRAEQAANLLKTEYDQVYPLKFPFEEIRNALEEKEI